MKRTQLISAVLLGAASLFFCSITQRRILAAPPSFTNETVIDTTINLPTMMEFLPDGRMLIGEFSGRIWIVQPGANTVDSTPFLTIINIFGDDIVAGGERGLVGITLDPNFASNGFFYLFYTARVPQRDRVSRFTAVGNTASLASEVVIWQDITDSLTIDHHGGGIAFGPDGKLYITTGDGGFPDTCQSLTSYHGKVIRVNPDGTIPTDNPFFDGPGPNLDDIWARGLRNPYRISFDGPTGKLYIGDVGQTSIEEVNIGASGANYGWPICEGPCGTAGMTNPIFSYSHNGRDAAITGGLIYRGAQFPSQYQGVYFYGDYAQNWIRYLTFDANGNVTGSVNFEPTDGTLDGPYGDPVNLKVGPDGSLYYVDFGFGAPNPASIRRIRYTAANQPPTAVVTATPTSGLSPLTVDFSSAGSSDPEGQPLSYTWTFGDSTISTQANPTHVYQQDGLYSARLTLSDGVNTTQSQTITIAVGNRPTATILSPANGLTFRAGDVISFSGTASDSEDGPTLPASAFSWTILFHHDTHVHPGLGPLTGVTSGTFTIPSSGHDFGGNTNYEIILTITDSSGLQDTKSVTINPEKVNLTFSTLPAGLQISIDGINTTTPLVKDALVGFHYAIGAPNQSQGANQYTFASWSDGGAQTHNITVPGANAAYTANYQLSTPPLPSGLVLSYGFNEGSGTSAADSSGNNKIATLLNGAGWSPSGKYGASLNLDGVDDYVEVPNPTLPTGNFSYTLWIKRDPPTGWRALFNGRDTLLEVAVNDNAFLQVYMAGSPPTSTVQIPTNTWTHVAVTRSGSLVTIYVNGVQNATGTSAGSLNLSSCPFRIGVDFDNNQICAIPQPGLNGYFDGGIDELRVYNRALSLAEIQVDMNTPSSPPPPDTTPPLCSNGQPVGTLSVGTTQTTISLVTDESATARYSLVPGTPYGAMTGLFSTTGGTTHSTTVTGLSNGGSYSFYVRCQDAAGNASTTDFVISFSVASPPPPDMVSPTVSLTAPANGATVSGSISVTATASDNVGVAGVQFLLDGGNLGAEDTASPFSVTWNTLSVANGAHTLGARARDAAGNVATTPNVNVTVANPVTPGLVAAYSFNEGIGNTIADASGNNNLGTITGASWTTAGRFGNALSFNGLSDCVTIPDSNSLDLTGGLTLEAWVFPTNTPAGWRTIIAKEQSDGLVYYLYASSRGTNQPVFGVFVSNAERNLVGGARLVANTWTHMAVTYNGSIQRLYLNGVQVATRNQTGTTVVSNGVLHIGGNSPFGEYFKGLIDDIRIYNVVRTQAQIQTDMNSPVLP